MWTHSVTRADYNPAMSANPELLWNAGPPPACKPRAGEPLYTLRKGHRLRICELRYHGEYGVEVQLLDDGELLCGYRFMTRKQAEDWAQAERADLERDGWSVA
jgi:hypothetical protein